MYFIDYLASLKGASVSWNESVSFVMIRVPYRVIFPYMYFTIIICNFHVWINIYRLNHCSYLLSWFATQVMFLKSCVINDVIAIHRCIDFNISNDDSILILLKDFLWSWYKMYLISYMVLFFLFKMNKDGHFSNI